MTPAPPRAHRSRLGNIAFGVPLVLIVVIHGSVGASFVGTTMLTLLVAKLVIARVARDRSHFDTYGLAPPLRVMAVVPLHNEDPDLAVAGIHSMLSQTVPLARICVVDDGSTDGGVAADAVEAYLTEWGGWTAWQVVRLPRNVGKRHALAEGFRRGDDVDVFLTVDSDTVLDRDAVENGIRPFFDPEVSAVAGVVAAVNWKRNLLTRLIDLRYVSAFLAERAAYSYFGAVLCCSGSLGFYRAEVVRSNLDDFVAQLFLGEIATFGDDRRLTNYALRAGRVVLAETSRAQTAVPERLGHYLRQQVRWNKSFIRESLWVLGTFPLSHGAFWLTVIEAAGWLVVGSITLASLFILPFLLGPSGYGLIVAATALAAYARNAVYLEESRPDLRLSDRLLVLFLAPVYAVIHLGMLLPLRVWALCTLRRTGWGTRSAGVEVRLAGPAAA